MKKKRKPEKNGHVRPPTRNAVHEQVRARGCISVIPVQAHAQNRQPSIESEHNLKPSTKTTLSTVCEHE
ncbi:unnamed protein product [Callosobruchus maculatus]|uniref:Uncharacterized protein n=1 Tax=Callosobruchus maculatus TaxID=64391 RepID=A0A653CWE0_CALMS|nr:unnamed protein product [Callosobruchus maculatus]